jgi:hypothetical protein
MSENTRKYYPDPHTYKSYIQQVEEDGLVGLSQVGGGQNG